MTHERHFLADEASRNPTPEAIERPRDLESEAVREWAINDLANKILAAETPDQRWLRLASAKLEQIEREGR